MFFIWNETLIHMFFSNLEYKINKSTKYHRVFCPKYICTFWTNTFINNSFHLYCILFVLHYLMNAKCFIPKHVHLFVFDFKHANIYLQWHFWCFGNNSKNMESYSGHSTIRRQRWGSLMGLDFFKWNMSWNFIHFKHKNIWTPTKFDFDDMHFVHVMGSCFLS